MNTMNPKARRSLRRGALTTLVAGAAALAVSAAAPSARAQEEETYSQYFGKLLFEGFVQGVEGEGISILGSFLIPGSSSSGVTVADVQGAISSALSGYMTSTDIGYYNTLVSEVNGYKRGATCDDLAANESNVYQYIYGSYGANYVVNALQTCGYNCASEYAPAGMIYVSMQKELYEIYQQETLLGCSGHTFSEGSVANQLNNYVSAAQTVLAHMKEYKNDFENQFTSSTPGVRWFLLSEENWFVDGNLPYCGGSFATEDDANVSYCMPYTPYGGSASYLCPNASLSIMDNPAGSPATCSSYEYYAYRCDHGSGWGGFNSVCTGDDATTQSDFTKIWFRTMKPYLRDQQLGANFWAIEASLQKIASGDYSYCGDGVCSVAEVRSVKATSSSSSQIACLYSGSGTVGNSQGSSTVNGDCTSSSYAELNFSGGLTYDSSTTATLLSLPSAGLTLKWSSGNLALYNSANQQVWKTATGSSAEGPDGPGTKLTFSTNGNISITDASNDVLWQTDTVQGTTAGTNPLPQTLVLMADGLHLMDDYWHEWWSSSSDWNMYADLESQLSDQTTTALSTTRFDETTDQSSWISTSARQCWSPGTTLLANNLHELVFTASGQLVVYYLEDGSTVWSSSASGSYLCNEEDGNLTIFDSTDTQVWTTGTGAGTGTYDWDNAGGDVVLEASQLRVLAASGEPLWSSATCSGDDYKVCQQDDSVADLNPATDSALTAGLGTSSTAVDILTNEYAVLRWQDGTLSLVDKTPESARINGSAQSDVTLWQKSGATLKWMTNQLVILDSNGNRTWNSTANSDTSPTLTLAGCNFFVGSSSDNAAIWSSHTGCTYNDDATYYVAAATD